MYYRMPLFFCKTFSVFGTTIIIRYEIFEDREAGVFIATSPDLKGLVCEEDNLTALKESINSCTLLLLTDQFQTI